MALLDNIVAHWKLNEASGTRVDNVGGYNLAPSAGSLDGVVGKIGNAVDITNNGSTNCLRRTTIPQPFWAISSYTVTAWIKRTADFVTDYTAFNIFKVDDVTNSKWGIPALSIQKLASSHYAQLSHIADDGTTKNKNHSQNLSKDVWYFMAGKWDGSNLSVSVDAGAWQIATSVTSLWQYSQVGVSNRINMGQRGEATSSVVVDSVSFWHRALSDAEIAHLYNNGNGIDYPFGERKLPTNYQG